MLNFELVLISTRLAAIELVSKLRRSGRLTLWFGFLHKVFFFGVLEGTHKPIYVNIYSPHVTASPTHTHVGRDGELGLKLVVVGLST